MEKQKVKDALKEGITDIINPNSKDENSILGILEENDEAISSFEQAFRFFLQDYYQLTALKEAIQSLQDTRKMHFTVS